MRFMELGGALTPGRTVCLGLGVFSFVLSMLQESLQTPCLPPAIPNQAHSPAIAWRVLVKDFRRVDTLAAKRRQSSTPIDGEKKAQASGAARRRPRAATSAHEQARTKTEALTKRLSPACSERRGCGRTKTSYAACAANTARDFGYARSAGLARKSWSSRRASRPACRTWT